MKKLRILFTAIALLPLITMAQKTVYISSKKIPCSNASEQLCIAYKNNLSDAGWKPWPRMIEGFTYQPGHAYILEVNEEAVAAGATTTAYGWALVKIVSDINEDSAAIKKTVKKLPVDGEWYFTKIYSGKTTTLKNRKEFIRFDTEKMAVNGKLSCNGFFGEFTSKGSTLKLGAIGSTMMACDNLDTENLLKKTLELVDNYTIKGNTLLLKKGKQTVLQLIRK